MATLDVNMTIVNNEMFNKNGYVIKVMMLTFAPINSGEGGIGTPHECEFGIAPRIIDLNIDALIYLLRGEGDPKYGIIGYDSLSNTYIMTWDSIAPFLGKTFRIKYKNVVYSYTVTANKFQEEFAAALAFGSIPLEFKS